MSATARIEPRSLMIPVIGLATLALLGTSVPVVRQPETALVRPGFTDGTGAVVRTATAGAENETVLPVAAISSVAGAVAQLRELTSFTWEQVAKLFGVSRRTVHLWAAGGNMAAHNQEQLFAVLSEISDNRLASPVDEKMRLLALLDRHRALHASQDADINRSAANYAADIADSNSDVV